MKEMKKNAVENVDGFFFILMISWETKERDLRAYRC